MLAEVAPEDETGAGPDDEVGPDGVPVVPDDPELPQPASSASTSAVLVPRDLVVPTRPGYAEPGRETTQRYWPVLVTVSMVRPGSVPDFVATSVRT